MPDAAFPHRLREELERVPVIAPHCHLTAARPCSQSLADLVLYHHGWIELVSAGMPATVATRAGLPHEVADPGMEPLERARACLPYLPHLRAEKTETHGRSALTPFVSFVPFVANSAFLLSLIVLLLAGCRPAPEPGAKGEKPSAPKLVTTDPWKLSVSQFGRTRVYLGNGYLGANVSQEGLGFDGAESLPCYASGYYQHESLATAPQWTAPQFHIGDRALSAAG